MRCLFRPNFNTQPPAHCESRHKRAIADKRRSAENGGLMSYGPNQLEDYRCAIYLTGLMLPDHLM